MKNENTQTLIQNLQRLNIEINLAYEATIEGFVRGMEIREREPVGHTYMVTETAIRLAKGFGVSDEALQHLRRGALLHDIGKLGIAESILHKTGPLSGEEWRAMRKHPQIAYDLLSPIVYLHPALDIPYCHHENWDGSGYPQGLKGDQIPLAARIFAVVDVWNALRFDRPFRKAWPDDQVENYMLEQAGLQFDPKIVKTFMDSEIKDKVTDIPNSS